MWTVKGRILHDRRVLFVQVVCQKLVFPGHDINFHFHLGGVRDTPSTPSPSEIRLTPSADTPYPHPSPYPGYPPRHPPGPLRPELQTHFLKNTNVTKFTITHPPTLPPSTHSLISLTHTPITHTRWFRFHSTIQFSDRVYNVHTCSRVRIPQG